MGRRYMYVILPIQEIRLPFFITFFYYCFRTANNLSSEINMFVVYRDVVENNLAFYCSHLF